MRILVTGATGFIGACLTRRLLYHGHEVHIFTRLESNRWRIFDLIPHLEEHNVDLRDGDRVETQINRVRPEVIFHLATYGGFASQNETSAIICSNFNGTINLLKACIRAGFELFVNTGSSSEYGIKSEPMTESDLLEPLNDYGVAKAAATLYCRSEAVRLKLPLVTFRLFSPYGPWDDPKRLIPYTLSILLRKESPRLANPAAVRDFIFIDDVIAAYMRALTGSITPGEIYNVGTGRQHSIAEVVGVICELVQGISNPCWGVRDVQRPEPAIWVADVRKITAALDWAPLITLKDGLTRTAEWMKDHMEYYSGDKTI
jgi:nucleoside-diphosphate-sugar epimerase